MDRLGTLEELLQAGDIEIGKSMVLTSRHETESVDRWWLMPTPAMVAGARATGRQLVHARLPRPQSVQLAWQGLRRQLSLFVAPSGRCILFAVRLAAFLQAGLLVPA
jgi:hypothetical protein